LGTDSLYGRRYIRPVTHTRAFRTLAAVLSAWLGICLAQPMQLHLCVMHGGLAIDAGHPTSHSAHGATHDAHHQSPSGEKSQQCSCLGDCATGSAPAFVVAPQLRVAIAATGRVDVSAAATSTPVTAPSFLLPYSNGPPSAFSLA
jgi:hypothetical protein